MRTGGKMVMLGGATLVAAALALSPATGFHREAQKSPQTVVPSALAFDMFTPAAADPRLAAHVAKAALPATHFAFTPVSSSSVVEPSHDITVAVRVPDRPNFLKFVQSIKPVEEVVRPGREQPVDLGIAPGSYQLGTSVGWKGFAQRGSEAQTELGVLQGGKKTVDIGVNQKRITAQVQIATEQPDNSSGQLNLEKRTTLDVGYAYRLSRKFDLTAGVRYKAERDRLDRAPDAQRDSKAVYIGTKFRF